MAGVTPQLIKELREMTGAGMMDCKNALNETNGDLDKAVQALREAGLGKAAKVDKVVHHLEEKSLLFKEVLMVAMVEKVEMSIF